MGAEPDDGAPFGSGDLYAAFLLQTAANGMKFGRSAEKETRNQTRFLFYMTFIELVREIVVRAGNEPTKPEITKAVTALLSKDGETVGQEVLDQAVEAIDNYMTPGSDNSAFGEPGFLKHTSQNLNAFLKWERLGKSETECPRYWQLISIQKAIMGARFGALESLRNRAKNVIYT